MVDFWEMNNQAMEVDAEKLSSRQFNWLFQLHVLQGVQTESIDYKDAELALVIFHLRYCSKF